MRTLRGLAALLVVMSLTLGIAACGSNEDVVARVNGEDITRAEFDRVYQQLITTYGLTVTDDAQKLEYQKALLASLVENELYTQEAERLDADLSEEAVDARVQTMITEGTDFEAFKAQVEQAGLTMEDVRRSVRGELAREFLLERASAETTGAPLAETYSLLEHILVSDETSATKLYEQITGGADFAALAQAQSLDTGSGAAGGSLGWSTTDAYVDEFKAAADALKVGELGKPVESEFGWHIIRKVDEAVAGTPLDELPADLRSLVESDASEKALLALVESLKAKADIEYVDETLAPTE